MINDYTRIYKNSSYFKSVLLWMKAVFWILLLTEKHLNVLKIPNLISENIYIFKNFNHARSWILNTLFRWCSAAPNTRPTPFFCLHSWTSHPVCLPASLPDILFSLKPSLPAVPLLRNPVENPLPGLSSPSPSPPSFLVSYQTLCSCQNPELVF